jgi:hypothetical protein
MVVPEDFSRSSHDWETTLARVSVHPVVCAAIQALSSAPSSMSALSTPLRNAMSPPAATCTKSSMSRVPKTADIGSDGTQYFSSPFSRTAFTTTMRVPRFLASARYFIDSGWLFERFVPISSRRSVPMRSESEHVGAP